MNKQLIHTFKRRFKQIAAVFFATIALYLLGYAFIHKFFDSFWGLLNQRPETSTSLYVIKYFIPGIISVISIITLIILAIKHWIRSNTVRIFPNELSLHTNNKRIISISKQILSIFSIIALIYSITLLIITTISYISSENRQLSCIDLQNILLPNFISVLSMLFLFIKLIISLRFFIKIKRK